MHPSTSFFSPNFPSSIPPNNRSICSIHFIFLSALCFSSIMSASLSVQIILYFSIHQHNYTLVILFICQSIYVYIYLFVFVSAYLSVCLYLFTYLLIYKVDRPLCSLFILQDRSLYPICLSLPTSYALCSFT